MFANAFQWHFPTPSSGDHLTVIVDLLRPVSPPGQVRLQSASYLDQANINLNFFASDLDLIAMREGVRFVDDIILNGKGMRDSSPASTRRRPSLPHFYPGLLSQ